MSGEQWRTLLAGNMWQCGGHILLTTLQDPDAGPPKVGDACAKVNSISIPPQMLNWTCGISVKGNYNCGGRKLLPDLLNRSQTCSVTSLLIYLPVPPHVAPPVHYTCPARWLDYS
jgi:hypothetical protein